MDRYTVNNWARPPNYLQLLLANLHQISQRNNYQVPSYGIGNSGNSAGINNPPRVTYPYSQFQYFNQRNAMMPGPNNTIYPREGYIPQTVIYNRNMEYNTNMNSSRELPNVIYNSSRPFIQNVQRFDRKRKFDSSSIDSSNISNDTNPQINKKNLTFNPKYQENADQLLESDGSGRSESNEAGDGENNLMNTNQTTSTSGTDDDSVNKNNALSVIPVDNLNVENHERERSNKGDVLFLNAAATLENTKTDQAEDFNFCSTGSQAEHPPKTSSSVTFVPQPEEISSIQMKARNILQKHSLTAAITSKLPPGTDTPSTDNRFIHFRCTTKEVKPQNIPVIQSLNRRPKQLFYCGKKQVIKNTNLRQIFTESFQQDLSSKSVEHAPGPSEIDKKNPESIHKSKSNTDETETMAGGPLSSLISQMMKPINSILQKLKARKIPASTDEIKDMSSN